MGDGMSVAGKILKDPEALGRDVMENRGLVGTTARLVLATVSLSAVYGAVVGMFVPGWQTLFAAAKLPAVILGTALLCTPTFFVFNTILGSTLSWRQTLALVLSMSTAAALILVAFAPVAWLFTVSTNGVGFLAFLHGAVVAIAFLFATRVMTSLEEKLSGLLHGGLLRVWFLIVLVVGLQMAYCFRPLILPGPFFVGERGLFIEWFSSP